MRRDPISSIAMYGAPLLVGALLLFRIINGHWGSVAFIAIMFAVVLVLYVRFVPLAELDDHLPASNTESPVANAGESSSADHSRQPGHELDSGELCHGVPEPMQGDRDCGTGRRLVDQDRRFA